MRSLTIGMMVLLVLVLAGAAVAHDGWIQTNVPRVPVGDMCYIDMLFGNHGNEHRDYLVWGSKWDVAASTFVLHTPGGQALDLADRTIDVGKDEVRTVNGVNFRDVNGYLVTSFQAKDKGIYIADVRQDKVVSYAPERSIKCAKAIVGAVPSAMGMYGRSLRGYDKPLSQVLEVIPLADPTDLRVGDTLTFRVLFKGVPLPETTVSVIPRGAELPPMGIENLHDLITDSNGEIRYAFGEANYHLIVVHVHTDEAGTLGGMPYQFTKYTGDLTVIVRPARSP